MHILGKTLNGFVFMAACAGLILMTRHLQVKNSYTKKLKDLKSQNSADALTIGAKESELRALDADYQRVMHDQMAYWDKVTGSPNPPRRPPNTLGMGVGTNAGVGVTATNAQVPGKKAQRRTSLHVFYQRDPNNARTAYIGPFVVGSQQGELTADNSLLYPDWPLRPAEFPLDNARRWPSGRSVYRLRAIAPSKYTTAFLDYYLKLDDISRDLTTAAAEKKQAEDHLKASEEENTRYRVIIAGQDGTGGMLAELSKAQDERDAVLGTVDRLRRELKREVDTRTDLIKKNKELVPKLPQPASGSGKP